MPFKCPRTDISLRYAQLTNNETTRREGKTIHSPYSLNEWF